MERRDVFQPVASVDDREGAPSATARELGMRTLWSLKANYVGYYYHTPREAEYADQELTQETIRKEFVVFSSSGPRTLTASRGLG